LSAFEIFHAENAGVIKMNPQWYYPERNPVVFIFGVKVMQS
jgi:hypothetical protein